MSKTVGSVVMRILVGTLSLLSCVPGIVFADPASECGGGSRVQIEACVADTLQRVDATVDIYLGFVMSSAKELDEVTARSFQSHQE